MSYDLATSFLTIQPRDIKEYIYTIYTKIVSNYPKYTSPAAAAAKLLQSCPTLCDPIDGSPPGSPDPGILQARTLEWVAISFSIKCIYPAFNLKIIYSENIVVSFIL